MRESVVETKTVAAFVAAGWLQRKVAYIGRRGAADRWFFKNGHLIQVEFKKPGEVPELHQDREHNRMRAHGFRVYVIDTVAEGLALAERMTKVADPNTLWAAIIRDDPAAKITLAWP